ncbi:MAG: hypothetical protein GY749_24760 [Desulfobacteraceae bacterium]|nr:hypothetical protein [Desulfobacteraceae bacterium]
MKLIDKKPSPDIEKHVSDLLKKKNRDYLTITQVRDSLPAVLLKQFGIVKKKSGAGDFLKKLKPYLGTDIWEYKGSKSAYLGFNMPKEKLILNRIRQNPGISPKNLARNLPMSKKDFISNLNKLLETGAVVCTFSETYSAALNIFCKTEPTAKPGKNDRSSFRTAYNKISRGNGIIRIHRIREFLNWSKERFDITLKDLMSDYTIELHGGDPSIMTEQEIKDSYTDENGVLYINMTWWGE